MVDVSTLGLISLIIRIVGIALFVIVIYKQIKLRFNKYHDELNGLRNLLIGLTLVPIIFNFVAITNNYVRWQNGVQSETINNISFVLGSLASTATALILYLIYKNK